MMNGKGFLVEQFKIDDGDHNYLGDNINDYRRRWLSHAVSDH